MFKVLHKKSGLYWKGGGMRSNNKSRDHFDLKDPLTGKHSYVRYEAKNPEHALLICFSKAGKTWSTLKAVKSALGYGHEEGLEILLKECEIWEIKSPAQIEREKILFAVSQLEAHIEHPTKPGYRRHDILEKIEELKQLIK